MSLKCYGSTRASKALGRGSTPWRDASFKRRCSVVVSTRKESDPVGDTFSNPFIPCQGRDTGSNPVIGAKFRMHAANYKIYS